MGIVYFETNDDNISNIKKIIKKQGDITCQQQIKIDYINTSSNSFSFGYMSITKKAQIGGVNKNYTDRYHLNGFIICDIIPNIFMTVKLVCSNKNAKIGKNLMEIAEEKAQELHIPIIEVFSISNKKIIKWYESVGFTNKGILISQKEKEQDTVRMIKILK